MTEPSSEDWIRAAEAAEAAGNLERAVGLWEALRAGFPDLALGVVCGVSALRRLGRLPEAVALSAEGLSRFPEDADLLIDHAWEAHDRGDWPEALHRWERAMLACPERAEPRRFAAQSLLELGRAGEAALVLAPALRLHPDDPDLWVLNAWIATHRGELTAAQALWRDVRERFPDRIEGYLGATDMLYEYGRPDEADALIGAAHARFPGDVEVAMRFARIPERKADWSLAIERWHDVMARFPDGAQGHLALSQSLRRAGRRAEADAALEACRRRHRESVEVALAVAEAAAAAEHWPEALRLWSAVTDGFPDDPRGYLGLGQALRRTGEFAAAAGMLREAHARFPDHVELGIALAATLSAQRRWPEALEGWASLKRRYPLDGRVSFGIMEMLAHALADQHAHGHSAFEIPAILLASDEAETSSSGAHARLLQRFESLGSDCEFGMVQRLYRVEHVSLLRWASTPPDPLIAALQARFEGVGDPEHTRIEVIGDEYATRDTRYFMHSHTFTSPRAESLERFAPEHCRRLQWQRRRLIESLTTASRIFVYKSADGITDAQISALFDALRQYSPRNVLLCVRRETPDRPSGTVDQWESGLHVGYFDRFSTVDIHVDAWLQICETVAGRCV